MKQITLEQFDRLDALYANGQFEGVSANEFRVLTELDAQRIIVEAEFVVPGTFTPVDEETRSELKELIDRGQLPFSIDELRYLSVFGAETLIWMSMSGDQNRENAISRSQQKRIKALIAKGFLHKLTPGEILLLSEERADKLILQGEETARYGQRE